MIITLPGSIFGKRIEVVHEAEDVMDYICVCPHCGKHVRYGNMMMISGHSCCDYCHDSLSNEIERDKAADYELYVKKDYEPFGVQR